MVDDSR